MDEILLWLAVAALLCGIGVQQRATRTIERPCSAQLLRSNPGCVVRVQVETLEVSP